MDQTPLELAARGKKRRMPPRGPVPLQADAKDARIAKLEKEFVTLIFFFRNKPQYFFAKPLL